MTQMTYNKKFEEIWHSLGEGPLIGVEDKLHSITIDLLAYLLQNILAKEKFEIGVHRNWFQKASVVTYKEPQKQIELRAFKNNNYQLVISFFDIDDKQFVYKHKLNPGTTKLIPEWLRDSMQNIKELERPITIFNPLK
jgi:hypothetical protein